MIGCNHNNIARINKIQERHPEMFAVIIIKNHNFVILLILKNKWIH